MWQKTYPRFLYSVANVYSVFLILQIISVLIAGRLAIFLGMPHLQDVQKLIFYSTLSLACCLLSTKRHRKLLLGIVLLWFLILLHSFANFFQPSLTWLIPLQDYLLADHVSAAWSWGVARTESKHLLGYFTIFLPIFLGVSDKAKRQVLWTFGLCLASNLLVGVVQNMISMQFLTLGSGTAVGAHRIPGLLEDSGAMSVLLAMLTSGLLWVTFFADLKQQHRTSLLALSFSIFLLGLLGCGRLYAVSTLGCFALLSIIKLFHVLFRKFSWVGLGSFGVLVSAWGAFSFISSHYANASLKSIQGYHLGDLFSIRGWEKRIDYQRTKHILAMWENTKARWPIGSGLGSFHSFCENIAKRLHWSGVMLDWPSSFYLQCISELGLAGLLLLNMIGLLFFSTLFATHQKRPLPFFVLGAFVALLDAWLIGIHYIFPSIALCIGAILAYAWSTAHGSFRQMLKLNFLALCCMLAGAITLLYIQAPATASEFHWQSRGKPQQPLKMEETAENKVGQWYRNGSELLIDREPIFLRLQHPPQYSNITFKFHVFHKQRGKLAELSPLALRNQWTEWHWPDNIFKQCQVPSPADFCYARLEVQPEWRNKKHKVGVLISRGQRAPVVR